MSEKYFESKNVKVFPCQSRGNYPSGSGTDVFDPEARLNSEFNYTHMYNNATGIIDFTGSGTTGTLKFVINGYHFEISNFSLSDTTNKYLYIRLADIDIKQPVGSIESLRKTSVLTSLEQSSTALDYLNTTDNKYYFCGLKGSDTAPAGSTDISIQILDGSPLALKHENFLPKIYAGSADNDIKVKGDLTVEENTVIAGTLAITGNTTATNLDTSGNTTIGGTLGVTGATTLDSTTVAALTATGNTTINGTLAVASNTTLAAAGITGNLSVTGNTTLANTTVNSSPIAEIKYQRYPRTEWKPRKLNGDIIDNNYVIYVAETVVYYGVALPNNKYLVTETTTGYWGNNDNWETSYTNTGHLVNLDRNDWAYFNILHNIPSITCSGSYNIREKYSAIRTSMEGHPYISRTPAMVLQASGTSYPNITAGTYLWLDSWNDTCWGTINYTINATYELTKAEWDAIISN